MSDKLKKLEELKEEGKLKRNDSSDGKLSMYDYTDKVNYTNNFTKTLERNRGTIYEKSSGKLVAKSFDKFPNFDKAYNPKNENFVTDMLTETDIIVSEKMDGSLGIIFWYNDKWNVVSRKSFESKQSKRAEQILQKYDISKLDKDITLSVEIIFPKDKKKVDYKGMEELFLLAAFKGEEEIVDLEKLKINLPIAKRYKFKNVDEAIKSGLKVEGKEGYVIRFSNGYRVKVKSTDHMKKVKKDLKLTSTVIWKKLNHKTGKVDKNWLYTLPEEFADQINKIVNDLENNFDNKKKEISDFWKDLCVKEFEGETPTVEQIQEYFKKGENTDKKMILFRCAKNDLNGVVHNLVKPKNIELKVEGKTKKKDKSVTR